MAEHVGHEIFEHHALTYGHPSHPLSLNERVRLIDANEPLPDHHVILSVVTPPPPGRCCHCGVECGSSQNVRQHAVAGYEWTRHPQSGERLRFVVTHCDACLDGDACSRDETTPGSGVSIGPGGWCEAMPTEVTLGISLFPGARYAGRFAAMALGALGVFIAGTFAIATSQGQQIANLSGPLASLIVPGDATSGHGFNAGLLRVLSGSAPANANAAETGTLGISWAMNATAFGTPSAALPSVTTAGAITNVTISNSITAGYGRLCANGDDALLSTSERRFQFAVGTSGSDMNFNTLTLVSGGTASITSLTITHGA